MSVLATFSCNTHCSCFLQNVPHFGEYQELREKVTVEIKKNSDPLDGKIEQHRPANSPEKPVPTVQQVVGRSLPMIGVYKNLDNKKQVVALINDVSTYSTQKKKNHS